MSACSGVGLLGCGDLGAQALEFLVEVGFVGQQGFEDLVALVEAGFELLELFLGLGRDGRGLREESRGRRSGCQPAWRPRA